MTERDDDQPCSFGHRDVEVDGRDTPFQGYFRIDRYRLRHRLHDGGWSGTFEREVLERGHAVVGILYDPVLDRLVMVEQFRIGAFAAIHQSPWFEDDFSPWLLEFVAGIIEDGESPEELIRREAVEEAGCTATDLFRVSHYLVSPGGSSESVFVYCGRVDASNAGGTHGLAHEDEHIRVLTVAPETAFGWVDDGRINNAMTVIGLQWFRMNRESLRKKWLEADG